MTVHVYMHVYMQVYMHVYMYMCISILRITKHYNVILRNSKY